MVNIAGRSKGCFTCRKRKVKCDEEKPTCSRCRNLELKCEGFPDLVFIQDKNVGKLETDPGASVSQANESPSGEQETRWQHHVLVQEEHHRSIKVFETTSTRSSPDEQRRFWTGEGVTSEPNIPGATRSSARVPESAMDPPNFKDSIPYRFLVHNLVRHLEIGRKSILLAWGLEDVSHTSQDCVKALALAFYGKNHHRKDVLHQGSVLYSRALGKLNQDLNDPRLSVSVLTSTIILALYEIIAPTDLQGWIRHANGIGRILQARGPLNHQSPQERGILEAGRGLVIAAAFLDAKSTFLSQTEWLTVPWADAPEQKSHLNRLMDLWSTMPGLIENLQDLKSTHSPSTFNETLSLNTIPSPTISPATTTAMTDLYQKIQSSLTQLQCWKAAWSDSFLNAVTQLPQFPSSSITPHHHQLPFTISTYTLTFPSLDRANEYTLYQSCHIVLGSLLLALSSPLSTPFPPPHTADSSLSNQRRNAALDICRAVPYALDFESWGCAGAHIMAQRLGIAMWALGKEGEEVRWVRECLEWIGEEWALGSVGVGCAAWRQQQNLGGDVLGKGRADMERDGDL